MNIVTDVILPLALAFIMFVLGLNLTGADFLRVLKQPRDFFVGAISQIILLPVIAFILIKLWPISPELAIGVMIIAAAPGGVTSNILTSFAKGDVALSISLTAVISLLCVITIPFIVFASAARIDGVNISQNISLLNMAINMFLIITVPVLLGVLCRKIFYQFTLKFEPIAKKISILLFVLVLIGAIVAEFFGSPPKGMGFRISTEAANFALDMVWAEITMAAIAGSTFYGIVVLLEKRITFWHPSQRATNQIK